MRAWCCSLLLLVALPLAAQDHPHAKTVRDFVAASNRHDVDTMLAATAEDFRWIQVVGDRAATEVAGHADLRSWLQSYFAGTPDAHAEIGPVAVHGQFASTIETASYTDEDGTRQVQSSTSVYEFAPDGRIRFVWYFGAQPQPALEDAPR
jgi:ketosteroid isomerase-like protein